MCIRLLNLVLNLFTGRFVVHGWKRSMKVRFNAQLEYPDLTYDN